jgi:hypothetical protein
METITSNPIYLFMSEQHGNQDNSNSENHYIPGACNMGKAEIKRRKMAGWSGLVLTAITIALLLWFNAPHSMRLAVFIPAANERNRFYTGIQ